MVFVVNAAVVLCINQFDIEPVSGCSGCWFHASTSCTASRDLHGWYLYLCL